MPGFEPLDVMQGILMLVRQVNAGRAEVENEFSRAVTPEGNLAAQNLVSAGVRAARELRVARPGRCALQRAARSGPPSPPWDAERKFDLHYASVPDHKQCECGAILRGVKRPHRLQAVRHRVHARKPHGLVHGVQRRRLRRPLRLRALSRTSRW
ncbi:MAG: hypothetical protein V9G23_12815 [Giesbergeria sp.]